MKYSQTCKQVFNNDPDPGAKLSQTLSPEPFLQLGLRTSQIQTLNPKP